MNRLVYISSLVVVLLVQSISHAQFTGMKYRIPMDANSLVLINAEKMFGSPVADRERWKARRDAAYASGISALPPDATEVVIAGRMDLEFGKSLWELALIKLSNDRNVTTVAQRFGGTMDEIDGRTAARLPDDHFVVQLLGNIMATYTPANRQDVSRWLKSTDVGTVEKLPAYLEQAFGYATKVGTPIVMAMDLEGVISPAVVKSRIDSMESLKGTKFSPEEFAKVISSVQGITLGITLEGATIGAVRIDFAESPQMLADFGKPLLIEVLKNQGCMVDDMEDWEPSISGNTFLLRGTLSTNGTRRVLSVLELPPTLTEAVESASSQGADSEVSAKLLASQQYFKSITTVLDDLREKPSRDGVKTFGQAAMWYDKYALKIDRMPILNVDEDLLKYGANIASSLRNAEMAMKGVGMRTSVRTASNNPSSYGVYSGWGGYRAASGYNAGMYGPQGYTVALGAGQASLQEKGRTDAIIRGAERTSGAASVQQIWQQIDEATAAIRRAMVSKYSADF